MEYKRTHPINIVLSSMKYLILLFLPLIRGFIASRNGFSAWLRGAWFDLLIIFIIFFLGFLRWYFSFYKFTENGIYYNRGFILNRADFIPYNKLSTLAVEHPFYFKWIRASKLVADTDAGSRFREDLSLTVWSKDANEIIELSKAPYMENHPDNFKKIYMPRNLYVAVLSFISSNSLTGAVFVATLITKSGDLLGREFENLLVNTITGILEFLAFGLPPAAAIFGLAILAGWIASFSINVFQHFNFSATRKGTNLSIKMGSYTKRQYSIAVPRINFVEIDQSVLMKMLQLHSVFINSSGYGKTKNTQSILVPAARRTKAESTLRMLLPEIVFGKREIRPRIDVIGKFIGMPIIYIVSIIGLFLTANYFFPSFSRTTLFVSGMFMLPAVWFLIVKIISFKITGIGEENGVYTLFYTFAFRIRRTSIPKDRIAKITIRQNFWQKLGKSCDVVIYPYGESKKHKVIPGLPTEGVFKMFGIVAPYEIPTPPRDAF